MERPAQVTPASLEQTSLAKAVRQTSLAEAARQTSLAEAARQTNGVDVQYDISELFGGLNPKQREAVGAPPGHYLVLAGAGSGKTSVLTRRIAYLIQAQQVWPHAIFAVTFTNKAAAAMRGRLESLMQQPHRGMWIGTFHGLANKLLRLHLREANLSEGFQILDADDQLRMIKRVIADLAIDTEQFAAKQAMWLINAWKDDGLRPNAIQSGLHRQDTVWIDVYRAYEVACQRANVVDFAELLLRAHETLLNHPALLAHYQQRFSHLLVDEFQDTNALQYAWVRLLAGEHGQVMAVGDDDQSIYSWRGAKVEHMQRFSQDFSGASLIRLEQNYRSTGTILAAANAVIANNEGRLGKQLWTEAPEGAPIRMFNAFDDQEEARFVVEQIQSSENSAQGRSAASSASIDGELSGHAILYRSNAQSRLFEEALMQRGLPYRVYGGLRFFERAEIKDALAYLRLLENKEDDISFERALLTPTKGVGEKTLQSLRARALSANISLFAACIEALAGNAIVGRAKQGITSLLETINKLALEARELNLGDLTEAVLIKSGLNVHYQREDRAEEGRAENLGELVNTVRRFTPPPAEDDAPELSPLQQFLAYAALEAGEHQSKPWEDAVQLMSLHAAKGLEFPHVYLVGMEEGLFPTQRASEAGDVALEEERRLAYVGITRARTQLTMTAADSRRRQGMYQLQQNSRFIAEIPAKLMQVMRPKTRSYASAGYGPGGYGPGGYGRGYGNSGNSGGPSSTGSMQSRPQFTKPSLPQLRLNGRVRHPLFGEGLLISAEGEGAYLRVEVRFDSVGIKWLQLAAAGLQGID